MKTEEILALYDQQIRKEIEFPGMRRDVLPHLVRLVRLAPGISTIPYSHLNEKNADAAIKAQIDYFNRIKKPFEWEAYEHDQPEDLMVRLEKHGFVPEGPGAIMVLDLQEVPQQLLQPVKADVRQVLRRAQLQDVSGVIQGVWGGNFDLLGERLEGHLEIPGYLNVYVAYVEDRPVSSGWIYFHPHCQFAYLYGGSTLEEGYRKRGFYTALLAIRTQVAIEKGYRFLAIDSLPMSQSIAARHSFRQITRACDFSWKGQNP